MISRYLIGAAALAIFSAAPALAQDHAGHTMPMPAATPAPAPAPAPAPTPAPVEPMDHSGHTMPMPAPTPAPAPPAAPPQSMDKMDHSAMDHGAAPGAEMMAGEGSGTARLPASEAMHGLHIPAGNSGTLMLHGYAWGIYTDQTGQRRDDKLYVQSMAMADYRREFAGGRFMARAMMSLEPAMRHDGYPNLFATGEVAYGAPLVDRQHPHDLFMELAARVDVDIAEDTSLFVYGGPVGEPALGPSAFMHRASAAYNPEAPITHHWFDSTHITYGVVTAGVSGRTFQLEASAFRGREPDEFRWNIEAPRLDSWSLRASLMPTEQLAFQVSYGELDEPEELHPGEDEHRFTASAHYNDGKGLSATLAFSNKQRVPGDALTAWLGEVNWNLDAHNTLFGRVENVANDELFPDHLHPLHDQTFRVSKFQAGYARRLPLGPFELALGGTVAAYAKPAALDPFYGSNPMGYTLFAKLSLGH